METSLNNMPDIVLNKILGKLDFLSILSLRKVSPILRNFIDYSKPDIDFGDISIHFDCDKINLHIPNIIHVQYKKHLMGCLLSYPKSTDHVRKCISKCDFLSLFKRDFEIITQFQKAKLQRFDIFIKCFINHMEVNRNKDSSIFLDGLEDVLKSRKNQLQTEKLSVSAANQEELRKILTHINENYLKRISIKNGSTMRNVFELDQIVALNQWKKCEKIVINSNVSPNTLCYFGDFVEVTIHVETMNSEMLMVLKEQFSESLTLEEFSIYYIDIDKTAIYAPFGETYQSIGQRGKIWFFRHSTSDFAFSMTYAMRKSVTFTKCHLSEVPRGFLIESL